MHKQIIVKHTTRHTTKCAYKHLHGMSCWMNSYKACGRNKVVLVFLVVVELDRGMTVGRMGGRMCEHEDV